MLQAMQDASVEASAPHPGLVRLVQEHLLTRLDGLDARAVAAYVMGFRAAFDLMRRAHAMMGHEEDISVTALLNAIERAQAQALAEPEEETGDENDAS